MAVSWTQSSYRGIILQDGTGRRLETTSTRMASWLVQGDEMHVARIQLTDTPTVPVQTVAAQILNVMRACKLVFFLFKL